MVDRVNKFGLKVDIKLANFIDDEVLKELNINSEGFWKSFNNYVTRFTQKNKDLLVVRQNIKQKLDAWHQKNKENLILDEYKKYLEEIGYLVPLGAPFSIETTNTDPEISEICGPQLVVPITNARYALNAANARWGSFYDAIYGTDILGDMPKAGGYDINRGNRVIKYAKNYLDKVFPLNIEKWENVDKIEVKDNGLVIQSNGKNLSLVNKDQYVGYRMLKDEVFEIILIKNNLHVRILLNPENEIGKNDKAKIADIY